MRKVIGLLVLTVFAAVVLATPVLAAQSDRVISAPWYRLKPITLVGKVISSRIEVPHYELWVNKAMLALSLPGSKTKPPVLPNPVYVLVGPFNFKAHEGKTVRVTGYVFKGPNIYMRGSILVAVKVEPIKL